MDAQARDAETALEVVLHGRRLKVPGGATLGEIAAREGEPATGWEAPVAALLDGRLVSLHHSVYDGAEIRLLRSWHHEGRLVYRRSLSIVIQAAVRNLYPGVRLVVGQSLGGGVFYDWLGEPRVSPSRVRALEREMHGLVKKDLPLRFRRLSERQTIRMFRERGMHDRELLLTTWWHESVRLVCLGDYFDIRHGPVATSTGRLPHFRLSPLKRGVLLRFPDSGKAERPRGRPRVVKALFDVYRETKQWNGILGVSTVGELNRACIDGEIDEIVRVAEGLHEQKIVGIAESIRRRGDVRIVLIAGPSSSGKTTFAKRLSVQLRVIGLNPVALSVDDYYVDREKTPLDENGEYDFEALEAVDLGMFNRHLGQLLAGRRVHIPRYEFSKGRRAGREKWKPTRVDDTDVLIIEGIHALNPRLTRKVAGRQKFGIYVSALTQLCLDAANRISTTDVRLVRRIVRDRLYRGYTASQTLANWASVKRGEAHNIFPFQDRADVMFNSTLVFELAVLKMYAHRFLLEVPHEDATFTEAYRLLKFLELFVGVSPDKVPRTSIIREFMGGSDFLY
jgi:uridine kinase